MRYTGGDTVYEIHRRRWILKRRCGTDSLRGDTKEKIRGGERELRRQGGEETKGT